MRLYEKLKENWLSEIPMKDIENMLRLEGIDDKKYDWLEKLAEAVSDINCDTDIKVELELDEEIMRLKRKK